MWARQNKYEFYKIMFSTWGRQANLVVGVIVDNNSNISHSVHAFSLSCNYIISTEGALRLPTTYDNHPSIQPNPIPSHPTTYNCEDYLSIENLI